MPFHRYACLITISLKIETDKSNVRRLKTKEILTEILQVLLARKMRRDPNTIQHDEEYLSSWEIWVDVRPPNVKWVKVGGSSKARIRGDL